LQEAEFRFMFRSDADNVRRRFSIVKHLQLYNG